MVYKSIIILKNINLENANAVSGITYGFPAISNFLGFTHALSRFTDDKYGVELGGCSVICHDYKIHSSRQGYNFIFNQTGNPLKKSGQVAPIIEEGRMHIRLSLIIECLFTDDDIKLTVNDFEKSIFDKIMTMKLAGGDIKSIGNVKFMTLSQNYEEREKCIKKAFYGLLPGFAIISREDELERQCGMAKEVLDTMLENLSIRYEAEQIDDSDRAEWHTMAKPLKGWLVPISVGYAPVSELSRQGDIKCTRDCSTFFRFVENIYTLGEWRSLHRIKSLDTIMWRYVYNETDSLYLCKNN